MALTITLSNTSGASYVFSKILQFQLKKEVYTPYTTFSAQFQTDGLKKFGTICKDIEQNGRQDLKDKCICHNDFAIILRIYQTAHAQRACTRTLSESLYQQSIVRLLSISTGNYMGIQQRFHQLCLFQ